MGYHNIDEVILLAGGFGKRLKKISKGTPKPLMKIYKNYSILDFIIEKLKKQNFKILLTVHYKSNLFFKKYKNIKNIKLVKETLPLGTGGAIKNCIKKIKKKTFLVINCDTLSNINYLDFINFYKSKKVRDKILVGGSFVKNTGRFGRLIINKKLFVKGFEEKSNDSKKGWINNGSYIVSKKFFKLNKKIFSFEKDLITNECLKSNVLVYKVFNDNFIDIGIPIDYEKAIKRYN